MPANAGETEMTRRTIIDEPPTDKQLEAEAAVERNGGNISAAARELGLTKAGLRGRLNALWTKRMHHDNAEMAAKAVYEEDVRRWPNYDNGEPRKTWEQLSEISRWSWIRDPRPRDLKRKTGREDER